MQRQIIIDTETTGMPLSEGHRIIEIGAVEMIDRRLTGNNYHQLINPKKEMAAEIIKIHSISNEMLLDKPLFEDIADTFIDFIQDSEVIIHNAPFDIAFFDAELATLRGYSNFERYIKNCIDTLVLAKQIRPGQQNNLDALCKHFGISLDERQAKGHGAILDSQLTAQVYLNLTSSQETLDFGIINSVEVSNQAAVSLSLATLKKLKVIRADSSEIQAHNQVLDDIQEKIDDTVVWRQYNSQ